MAQQRTLSYSDRKPGSPELSETLAAPATAPSIPALAAGVRSTVLPRVERKAGAVKVVREGMPRYEEVRRLGAGGQAEVTLTRDHDIGRQVATKRLLPERNDEGSVLRFAEEIRAVGQLEHPNIVPIHDVGVDPDGHYFFVMRYIEGETLETIIEKLRAGDAAYVARYTPEYRLQICNEILRAIEHAHSLGIVHRDLKPGNVMVGALGEVVVMDWGLAKRLDGGELEAPAVPERASDAPAPTGNRLFETHTGALLGTPGYMAPEQAAGQPVDQRSDIYALAVTFYEFFSLRHPRAHCQTVAEMIASATSEEIPLQRVLGDFDDGKAPAAYAHLVRHALARDPSHRYATVAAMRRRLEQVRDGKAPIECPVTFTQAILSWSSRFANRHPFLLMGGMLGFIALVVTMLVIAIARVA